MAPWRERFTKGTPVGWRQAEAFYSSKQGPPS